MTTGKTTTLTRQTFVGKVTSLLFNMLSRLVIPFLPRSKCLLISWLQSPSAVPITETKNLCSNPSMRLCPSHLRPSQGSPSGQNPKPSGQNPNGSASFQGSFRSPFFLPLGTPVPYTAPLSMGSSQPHQRWYHS